MSSTNPQSKWQEKIALLYYKHGILCSSYPWRTIFFSSLVVMLCCYPLLNLPLPGNAPREVFEPFNCPSSDNQVKDANNAPNFNDHPFLYIQQIIVRAAVHPWTTQLQTLDAFRAPLAQVFSLVEQINNFQSTKNTTLNDVCVHVEGIQAGLSPKFPEFNCLTVSPANLWDQELTVFKDDTEFLETLLKCQKSHTGGSCLAELILGVPVQDSGIKRFPFRSRSRAITYAITLALKTCDKEFVDNLAAKLYKLHPLYSDTEVLERETRPLLLITFPERFSIVEFLPLIFVYVILFLYIYFSVCKIEMVKSKAGMALSAVVTVIASLAMSMGICTAMGIRCTLLGREIFPYLVAVIGLENILVLTRSVVSTPTHLDVKIRVAQGLSKEGWSITKNLIIEVGVLIVGILTFVPAFQEFCLFAIVGLLSDYFLQMCFFATVLSIDILRMERSEMHRHQRKKFQGQDQPGSTGKYPTVVLSRTGTSPLMIKLPKRIRVVYFWARTRFFQRVLVLGVVSWIAIFIYRCGLVGHILNQPESANATLRAFSNSYLASLTVWEGWGDAQSKYLEEDAQVHKPSSDLLLHALQHVEPDVFPRLSYQHWPDLFSLYNISLNSKTVAILPPIRLSMAVSPEDALKVRNVKDAVPKFQWQNLAASLQSIKGEFIVDDDLNDSVAHKVAALNQKFAGPSHEVAFSAVVAIIVVFIITYIIVALYRIVCSKNYAEWRTNWWNSVRTPSLDYYSQIVAESIPLILDGHKQPVECISVDEDRVASICLAGHLWIWDSQTGEARSHIDRSKYFASFRARTEANSPPLPHSFKESSIGPSNSGEGEFHGYFPGEDSLLEDSLSQSNKSPSTSFSASSNSTFLPSISAASPSSFNSALSPMSPPSYPGFSPPLAQSHLSFMEQPQSLEQRYYFHSLNAPVPAVWCMEWYRGLLLLGCADGRLEVWDENILKCAFWGDSKNGISKIRISGSRIWLAKMNGVLDVVQLCISATGQAYVSVADASHVIRGPEYTPQRLLRRTNALPEKITALRDGAMGGASQQPLSISTVASIRAHIQPVTVMETCSGRVVTGAMDHTLKVIGAEDCAIYFALHGHCGPISALCIDKDTPTAASGGQDGMLCLWDIGTGACMYSLQAHDGAIVTVTYTVSYLISLGVDEELRVWERFQGHLLHALPMSQNYCASIAMLSHRFLITGKKGSLAIWDVTTGEPVRFVRLGESDECTFVRQIAYRDNTVVCDYGTQLRIVRFPTFSAEKND